MKESNQEGRKYHQHNYLKLLIFEELYDVYPKTLTMPEIAERINYNKSNIADALLSYNKYKYVAKYQGNKKGTKRKVWKYRINILGIQTLLKLRALHGMGKELNLRKLQRGENLEYVDSYIGYSKPRSIEQEDNKLH